MGDKFAAWVKERIEERNSKVKKEQNMLINMDPEVAAALQASTAVSRTYYFLISLILLFMIVVKGCGVDMLKMGNARRRSKKEIMDSKIKEAQDKADIQ